MAAVEISNLVNAMVSLRSNGVDAVQLLNSVGFLPASLARVSDGEYTIDLELALTKAIPASPADGFVNYQLLPNLEAAGDWSISAELIEGAVAGRFDRVAIHCALAGAPDDPADDEPFNVVVLRYPTQ